MDPETKKKPLNAARRSRLVGEPSGLAACTSSTTLFRSVHGSGKATWHGELPSSVDEGTGHVGTYYEYLLRPTNDIPDPPRTVRFTDKRNLCQNTSFLIFFSFFSRNSVEIHERPHEE